MQPLRETLGALFSTLSVSLVLRLSGCYPAALEAGVSLWEDTRRGLECGVAPLALGSSVATLLAVLL